MAVTDDELELPIAVADTAEELGKLIGKSGNAIHSAISHAKKRGYKSHYVAVDVEDT